MLEMIGAIPKEIGWGLVGFIACLCCIMAIKLGKVFLEMWQDCHEEEEEEV